MTRSSKRFICAILCLLLSITSLICSIVSYYKSNHISYKITKAPEKSNETASSFPEPENTYTYEISETERLCILEVLIGECRGESFIGQMAVAQCIRDTAEYYGIRPDEVIERFAYYKGDISMVDEQVQEVLNLAIDNVFTKGVRVTPSRIMFFYNPDKVKSKWHESQKYVITIDHHKFFDIKEEIK